MADSRRKSPGDPMTITQGEYDRLRAIEDAARWHHGNSACAGWMQGEVLALALGLDPDAPRKRFLELLDALGIDPKEEDEIPDWLGAE